MSSYTISVGGIREAVDAPDFSGVRVLADRLWPRGLRKTDLGNILWYRDASTRTPLKSGASTASRIPPTEIV